MSFRLQEHLKNLLGSKTAEERQQGMNDNLMQFIAGTRQYFENRGFEMHITSATSGPAYWINVSRKNDAAAVHVLDAVTAVAISIPALGDKKSFRWFDHAEAATWIMDDIQAGRELGNLSSRKRAMKAPGRRETVEHLEQQHPDVFKEVMDIAPSLPQIHDWHDRDHLKADGPDHKHPGWDPAIDRHTERYRDRSGESQQDRHRRIRGSSKKTAATDEQYRDAFGALYEGGTSFNGYPYLGYIGNSDRNYLTDEWVFEGARELGWSEEQLIDWACSKWGRWALDAEPHSAADMLESMKKADSEVKSGELHVGKKQAAEEEKKTKWRMSMWNAEDKTATVIPGSEHDSFADLKAWWAGVDDKTREAYNSAQVAAVEQYSPTTEKWTVYGTDPERLGSKQAMRYSTTIEYWAPDDIPAANAARAAQEAVQQATTPYPAYVDEDGIATGSVEIKALQGVFLMRKGAAGSKVTVLRVKHSHPTYNPTAAEFAQHASQHTGMRRMASVRDAWRQHIIEHGGDLTKEADAASMIPDDPAIDNASDEERAAYFDYIVRMQNGSAADYAHPLDFSSWKLQEWDIPKTGPVDVPQPYPKKNVAARYKKDDYRHPETETEARRHYINEHSAAAGERGMGPRPEYSSWRSMHKADHKDRPKDLDHTHSDDSWYLSAKTAAGISYEIEPSDVDSDWYVDFEDTPYDEMTDEWHNKQAKEVADHYGVPVPTGGDVWTELEKSLVAKGLGVYNSDTRFEVYVEPLPPAESSKTAEKQYSDKPLYVCNKGGSLTSYRDPAEHKNCSAGHVAYIDRKATAYAVGAGEAYDPKKHKKEVDVHGSNDWAHSGKSASKIAQDDDDMIDAEDLDMSDEPSEEDYTYGDDHGQVSAGQVGGNHLGSYADEDEARKAIAEEMARTHFYPDVWWISDHGNAHNVSADFYEEFKDIINMGSKTAGEIDDLIGKCPVCGNTGDLFSMTDGGPCMKCVKARQRAAMDGRCHCGRQAIPGEERKPFGERGRKWIPCERCLGTIKQTGSKMAAEEPDAEQSGEAMSHDRQVEVTDEQAKQTMFPWEIDSQGKGAADVAGVPTPGRSVGDYPQPRTSMAVDYLHTAAEKYMPRESADDPEAWDEGYASGWQKVMTGVNLSQYESDRMNVDSSFALGVEAGESDGWEAGGTWFRDEMKWHRGSKQASDTQPDVPPHIGDPMWPLEPTWIGEGEGDDAADVADTPTPGQKPADYPQPKAAYHVTCEQCGLSDWFPADMGRQAVEAHARHPHVAKLAFEQPKIAQDEGIEWTPEDLDEWSGGDRDEAYEMVHGHERGMDEEVIDENGHQFVYDQNADVFTCKDCSATTSDPYNCPDECTGSRSREGSKKTAAFVATVQRNLKTAHNPEHYHSDKLTHTVTRHSHNGGDSEHEHGPDDWFPGGSRGYRELMVPEWYEKHEGAKTAEYNGWTNWVTWMVNLWLGNDQGLYEQTKEVIRNASPEMEATRLENFVRELPKGVIGDLDDPAELDEVNWDEIVDGFKEDLD